MKAKDSTAVLDFFRDLAESREQRSLDAVVLELAPLFDADAIGLNGIDGSVTDHLFDFKPPLPRKFPWQADAGLLQRARCSLRSEAYQDDGGNWLLSMVSEPLGGETLLVWAYRSGRKGFSDTDRSTWMFASQALVRWRMQKTTAAAPLQRRLELAAVLTSRLSHDFGNYLTGIMGFTELSQSLVPMDSILYRYLQEVLESAKQGADWIRRLHLFCRHSAAQAWPTLLSTVLAEEEARLRSAGVLELRWVTNLPNDLPLLAVDAGALQTALTELVNNACEAGGNQGKITFTARSVDLTEADCRAMLGGAQPGNYVEVTVMDDGPGIAAGDRARLFREMFFSTKPRHRGLGLLVVFGIVQRCRGGLRLVPAEGKGTVVQLYLPVAALEGSLALGSESPHLLLVHSNPFLFESMRKMLELQGCRVSVAISPQAALSACLTARQSFALIVTDVLLAQMSGLDLAHRILDHDPKADFLFLHTQSAFHGLAEEEMLKRFTLLRWPLQVQDFLKAVQTALARNKEKS